MKRKPKGENNGDLRAEYDFAAMKGGVRGKYYAQYRRGTNVVLLEPDVAQAFPTENAVNQALRGILRTTRAVRRNGGLSDHILRATQEHKRRNRG
jgi:hypothetical protein